MNRAHSRVINWQLEHFAALAILTSTDHEAIVSTGRTRIGNLWIPSAGR